MAKIISISLDEETLGELEEMQKKIGFSGRSETIRAGIKSLKSEYQEKHKLKGNINATLTVIHEHAKDIGKLTHRYQGIITSHLHNHIGNNKCMDIFVLKGNSSLINGLIDSFQKNKGVEQARLTVC